MIRFLLTVGIRRCSEGASIGEAGVPAQSGRRGPQTPAPFHPAGTCAMMRRPTSKETVLSLAQTPPQPTTVAGLAGVAVIARIRRVLILAVIAAMIYPTLMVASSGYCPGGVDGNGGFIDASGRPVDEAPACVQMTLGPSPLVYIGIALIVLLAIGRVMRASDEPAALRTLDRAAIGVGVLVAAAVIVSVVWFSLVPLDQFSSGSWSVFSPFPFGVIDVEVTPMTAS